MDDPQADAMGGGAERGYGEQCADTDGLAAATDAFETALQDAEQRLADGLAARAARAFYLNADANKAYCARWIEARQREAEFAFTQNQHYANTNGLAQTAYGNGRFYAGGGLAPASAPLTEAEVTRRVRDILAGRRDATTVADMQLMLEGWQRSLANAADAAKIIHPETDTQRIATLERKNAELRAECLRLIDVERRTYERFEAAATRQPLSAGWHHLACVTAVEPKPLPARALNARHRGGLITHPGDH